MRSKWLNGWLYGDTCTLDSSDQNCLQRFVRCLAQENLMWRRSICEKLSRQMYDLTIALEGVDISLVCVLLQFCPPLWSMARWGVQQREDRRRADGCEQSQSVVSIICHLGVCAMLARHCTARRILSPFCHCYHCLSRFITSCHSLLCIVTLTHMPWHTLSKADHISHYVALYKTFPWLFSLFWSVSYWCWAI